MRIEDAWFRDQFCAALGNFMQRKGVAGATYTCYKIFNEAYDKYYNGDYENKSYLRPIMEEEMKVFGRDVVKSALDYAYKIATGESKVWLEVRRIV